MKKYAEIILLVLSLLLYVWMSKEEKREDDR